MAFDFKKEYKEFYLPKNRPEIVTVPAMNYVAVRGKGDPNEEGGAYKQAVGVLYAVAYTIKMSKMGSHRQEGETGFDYGDKSKFSWISAIRLPDFVTEAEFNWAVEEAGRKKKIDCSGAEFLTVDEGLCVQMLHVGAFDDEPASVALMDAYIGEQGYCNDLSETRRHHEIYLSDARKVPQEKWRTVIRHPIAK